MLRSCNSIDHNPVFLSNTERSNGLFCGVVIHWQFYFWQGRTANSVLPTQSKHQPVALLSTDDVSNVPLQIYQQAYCPRDILPGSVSALDKPVKTFSYPLAMLSRLRQNEVLRVPNSRQSSSLHVSFWWYDRLGRHLL